MAFKCYIKLINKPFKNLFIDASSSSSINFNSLIINLNMRFKALSLSVLYKWHYLALIDNRKNRKLCLILKASIFCPCLVIPCFVV